MNLTLTTVHKTKKTNKLYYTGDDPILTDPPPPIAQVLGAAVTEGYRIRVRILRTMHLTCTPTNPKNPLHCSSLACYVIGPRRVGGGWGALGYFLGVGMCRPGLQIGTPF